MRERWSKLTKTQKTIIKLIIIIVSLYLGLWKSPLINGGFPPLISGMFFGIFLFFGIGWIVLFIYQKHHK